MPLSDLVITINAKPPTLSDDLARHAALFGSGSASRLARHFAEEQNAQIEAISNLSGLWRLSFDDARARFQQFVSHRPWDWRTCYLKIMAGYEDALTSIPNL